MKITGDRVYAAIIQTPPYHVDYIPLPWSTNNKPVLNNFTYSPALKSTYSHDKKGENVQDVKFDVKSSAEIIEGLSMDATKTKVVKKAAAFAIKKASEADADKILDTLVDKVDSTKTNADKTTYKTSLSDKIETSAYDRIIYYSAPVHVWRYKIHEPAPEWLFNNLEEGTKITSGDKYLTFSVADTVTPVSTAGIDDGAYQQKLGVDF